jgi:hypothetical protein
MSDPPRLPVSFLVGIFSALALGVAWGLVYFSAPTPAPVVTVLPAEPAPLSAPPPVRSDVPLLVPPSSPSSPAALPDLVPSSVSPETDPLATSAPPPEPPVIPPPPGSKAVKLPPSLPSASAPETHAASAPPVLPGEDVPALQSMSPSCILELEQLCEGTEPGGARRKCFKDHEERLSPACRRQVDEMAARIKEDMRHFKAACEGDIKQSCPNVAPGGGNILQCLEENYKEVSENCYQALKRFKTMKAGRSL